LIPALLLVLPSVALGADPLVSVHLTEIPHVRQKPDFCGEACAVMALKGLGHDTDQDAVFDLAGLDPALGRGLYAPELKRAVERLGFRPGKVWHKVSARAPDRGMEPIFRAIHADLKRGVPSIVCTRFDESPDTTEHFRLVVGYDAKTDEVIYHDPALDDGASMRMKRARLFSLWPLKYDAREWTVIRLALDPGRGVKKLAPPSPSRAPTAADYAQRVQALKERLPSGFKIDVEPPFVVISDGPKAARARGLRTVRWATRLLKKDFFPKDPRPLDIYLFHGERSYRKHTKALFGDSPDTPYGYYSSDDDALIMNIATGYGTLVHEMVHPFVEANFKGAPAWLNEGLGSLFEACDDKDGHIVGLLNWRLPGLQESIAADEMPPLTRIMRMSEGRFYADDSGTHYAASRYLLYYLQERGLLRDFYRRFHAHQDTDPSGVRSLQRVLGTKDLRRFQRKWERWVLKLDQ
jgi:hypothetical protein